MKLTVAFKHLEHTPSLDERIEEKSQKLIKYLGEDVHVNWICSAKDGEHVAELDVRGPSFEYFAKASSSNLYKSFDLAISKVEKQLAKKKEKMKNKIHRRGQEVVILDPEQAWTDREDLDDE